MRRHALPVVLGSVSMFLIAGCDYFKSDEPAPPVEQTKQDDPPPRRKATSREPVEVSTAAPERGIEFSFDPAASAPDCFATLVAVPGGPNVLKVTSYESPEAERFPSFLLWAKTPSATPEKLAGQSVPAEMFAQLEASGPVYQNTAAESVTITIEEADGGQLKGTVEGKIAGGNNAPLEITGSFQAALLQTSTPASDAP